MIAALPGPGDSLADDAAEAVRGRTGFEPAVCIVLGSGLGAAVGSLREEASFGFGELPGFPRPTVPGHAGRLVLGELGGVPVAAFLGRIHYYEGNDMNVCALPVRLARLLGAGTAILTAATGGIGEGLTTGHLVVGMDHLNLMGVSPLRGWRSPDGSPPFVDMVGAYDRDLADLAMASASDHGVPVSRGVYAAMSGPSFETPAEIEMLRRSGASVVGMSVVPEAVPARAMGMRLLGLFFVSNEVGVPVSHEEVIKASDAMAAALGEVIRDVLMGGAGWTAT
ncbi:MAG TPA: purine-nucleoside phosphorylase [Actinomycetota bacterium]|nr:purine-nucleoside phosphorylase [Actinomycetota bacterium]